MRDAIHHAMFYYHFQFEIAFIERLAYMRGTKQEVIEANFSSRLTLAVAMASVTPGR
jgi:hypothetical protein